MTHPIDQDTQSAVHADIKAKIEADPVVLFMKGSAQFPMCGFSGRVVHLLKQCGAPFVAYNVLEDEELRQGIKTYSNWPTIPQLYIRGEFIGGADIVTELYESGELQPLLAGESTEETR